MDIRDYFARAVLYLFETLELPVERNILGLYRNLYIELGSLKLKDFMRNRRKWYLRASPKNALGILAEFHTVGKDSSKETFYKTLNNTVRGKHLPEESRTEEIEQYAFAWHLEQNNENPSSTNVLESLKGFLVAYRNYLINNHSSVESVSPPWDWYQNVFVHSGSGLAASIDYEAFFLHLTQTEEYLRKHLEFCDSAEHSAFLLAFESNLKVLHFVSNDDRERGLEDFTGHLDALTDGSFLLHQHLLSTSLARDYPEYKQALFSDTGFADSPEGLAVWTREPHRKRLLQLMRYAKDMHGDRLSARRLLLFDRWDPSELAKPPHGATLDARATRAEELAVDIGALLRAGIDVAIGNRAHFKELDADGMSNYCLISDGVVTRAAEGHKGWQAAKLAESHHQLNAYKSVYEDVWNSQCHRFAAADYPDLNQADTGSVEQRIKSITQEVLELNIY